MSEDRLRGPRLKIERADEHIRELETAIKRFHESNPYEIVREVNAKTGDLEYWVRLRALPPARLASITGDAIHNLRSALDLLWCQLVEARGKTVAQSDTFVISASRNKFEAAFKGVKQRIPGPARATIDALKPYDGGHDGLWRLHQLDVIDKHRLLLAVFASNEAVILTMKMTVPWQEEPIAFPPLGLRPADRRVEDGTVLYRVPVGQDVSEIHEEPQFRIDIALDEPPIVECEPVLPLLAQLRSMVTDVLDLFVPVFA